MVFQFHSGAIKTHLPEPDRLQLLPFQFHSGAIKTPTRSTQPLPPTSFQFHSGAIKTSSHQVGRGGPSAISIPLWCD